MLFTEYFARLFKYGDISKYYVKQNTPKEYKTKEFLSYALVFWDTSLFVKERFFEILKLQFSICDTDITLIGAGYCCVSRSLRMTQLNGMLMNLACLLFGFHLEFQNRTVCTVNNTPRTQFNISANALEIRALHIPRCIVWYAVDCTYSHQHIRLCTALIPRPLAPISTCKCTEWRAFDRTYVE
jgi:hypothetical protein